MQIFPMLLLGKITDTLDDKVAILLSDLDHLFSFIFSGDFQFGLTVSPSLIILDSAIREEISPNLPPHSLPSPQSPPIPYAAHPKSTLIRNRQSLKKYPKPNWGKNFVPELYSVLNTFCIRQKTTKNTKPSSFIPTKRIL